MTATTAARPDLTVTGGPLPEDMAALVERLASRVASDGTLPPLPDVAPFTGGVFAEVPQSSDSDVAAAFRFARAAQANWARTSPKERSKIMLRFHDLVLAHRDEGLDLVQWETGKARRDALEELLDVLVTTRHYARDAARLLRTRKHRGAIPVLTSVEEHRHPKGVVGIIAPWNYPLNLPVADAVPALMAGNSVVLKPDSQTPLIGLWIQHLMLLAGLPEGVFEVVVGAGTRLGPQIVSGSDYLMFTGSTAVGRLLAAQAGERLIGCSLELGGKNALLVAHDADIEKAAEVAARASFFNGGQACVSMERLFVHRSIEEEFLDAFVSRVRDMHLRGGVGWGSDMGSLISQSQLDTVAGHVDDAVAKGAEVLAGGRARPDLGPFFYEPTVLRGVTEEMAACENETFGPVVAVYPFDDEESAIERANNTAYGLNAAIISRDTKRARRVARRLRAGTVNINEGYAASWASTRAPMGGMGDSGLGRRHGDEGLLKYTESQTVATQRMLGFGAPLGWSDETWGNILTTYTALVKRAGLK